MQPHEVTFTHWRLKTVRDAAEQAGRQDYVQRTDVMLAQCLGNQSFDEYSNELDVIEQELETFPTNKSCNQLNRKLRGLVKDTQLIGYEELLSQLIGDIRTCVTPENFLIKRSLCLNSMASLSNQLALTHAR